LDEVLARLDQLLECPDDATRRFEEVKAEPARLGLRILYVRAEHPELEASLTSAFPTLASRSTRGLHAPRLVFLLPGGAFAWGMGRKGRLFGVDLATGEELTGSIDAVPAARKALEASDPLGIAAALCASLHDYGHYLAQTWDAPGVESIEEALSAGADEDGMYYLEDDDLHLSEDEARQHLQAAQDLDSAFAGLEQIVLACFPDVQDLSDLSSDDF
jgi:hypothetical protein